MPVVAARVHFTRHAGAVGDVVRFLYRQSVHVGAEEDAAAAAAPRRHDAGPAYVPLHAVAECVDPAGDELTGAGFFESKLRVLV
jgi:hypothetical protein